MPAGRADVRGRAPTASGAGTRARLVAVLLRTESRALPWRSPLAAALVGLLLAAVPWAFAPELDQGVRLNVLRATALCGALAAAFLLDDPARHTTGAVPVPRPLRQALRVGLVLPVAALWWAAALLLSQRGDAAVRAEGLPYGAVTLEAATLCALAVALSAGVVRCTGVCAPGAGVGGAVLALVVVVMALQPDGFELFVPLRDPRWEVAHQRWAVLLAVAVLGWAGCAPDPVRRLGRRRG
ncbi:ABC transporter [Streptomyces oceani]|uniref:ABC transporter n=1 Tax=Streptomyces oceani TaxID=1075402 RepID=UPI0026D75F36